ncbi:TPA: hypothetical protein ACNH87_003237 [Klebsiella quasipneumoniae]
MSKSFPEWWKHGQKVRTANDGVLTLNIAEDSEYWLTNNAGKEVSVFSMDILGPASVPEACRMTTDITELAQREKFEAWWEREYKHLESSKYTDTVPHIKYGFWMAYQAGGAELVEALEKAQQTEKTLESRNRRLDGIITAAEKRIAELESRTMKLSPELYTIGELIRTQDNRITDQPMFVVFQKREIIGSDEHSPSRICWVWDGEEVSELRAKRLEALYQDGRDTRGYDRYAMQEVDEFVTACFTEHGCKDYLRQNGHNLRLPYIYACGSFRNNEYQLVRNWLAGIKWEAE